MGLTENQQNQQKLPIKPIVSSILGSTLEWYDFFLYGTAAALIFPKLFFAWESPFISLLLSYTTFAIAFLSRPLGSILFSRIGDRVGRGKTLIITTVTMGVGTTIVGVLPGYSSIGIWAPVLLTFLRFLQGIALGGEWGGGMLLATENATKGKKGLYGSLPQMGLPIGLLAGGLAFSAVDPNSSTFMTYGWRIPFLLSIVFVILVLWVSRGLEEPEEFTKSKESKHLSEAPIRDVLKHHMPAFLKVFGTRIAENASYYILTTYFLTYTTSTLHYTRGLVLDATNVAGVITIFTIPLFGYLSDFIGKSKIFMFGSLGLVVFAIPYYRLMNISSNMLFVAAIISIAVVWSAMYAVEGGLYTELFPAEVRYSGISIGYQSAGILAGGPAPFIVAYLMHIYGHTYLPAAYYLMVIGIISSIAAYFIKDVSSGPARQTAFQTIGEAS